MGSVVTSLRGNAGMDEVAIRVVTHVTLAGANRIVVAIDVELIKRSKNEE